MAYSKYLKSDQVPLSLVEDIHRMEAAERERKEKDEPNSVDKEVHT